MEDKVLERINERLIVAKNDMDYYNKHMVRDSWSEKYYNDIIYLQQEITKLKELSISFADRIGRQSELLSKKSEKVALVSGYDADLES